jgi:hypothetical protein
VILTESTESVIKRLADAPPVQPYDTIVLGAVDRLDAEARKRGELLPLIHGYLRLAGRQLSWGRRDRANQYIDRLLAAAREQLAGDDPGGEKARSIPTSSIQSLLRYVGREGDWTPPPQRDAPLKVAVDRVWDEVRASRLDAAARLNAEEVRPLDAIVAERVDAAIRGDIDPASAPGAAARPVPEALTLPPDPGPANAAPQDLDRYFKGLLHSIARAHAKNGQIVLAARQMIALDGRAADLPGALDEWQTFQWRRLASLALEGGHTDAARDGFERALAARSKDAYSRKNEVDRLALVREALNLNLLDLAKSSLETTGKPWSGEVYALSKGYRAAGDVARADAKFVEALALARQPNRGGGETLARTAVDLHAAGQTNRAEKLLLEAVNYLDGPGFGFRVMGAVVKAAGQMNRPDLLDRLYAENKPGIGPLLCISAARAGLFPPKDTKSN